ncbi:MAG TPA: ribonuclease H [Kofleriaceae bacterium]|nr:ribonuclease H [Kofleriaceae bacterium]
MPWIRRKLRDALVYVRARADGQPDAGRDGRVDVMYQLRPGAKLYRASARNLAATGDPADDAVLPDPDAPAPVARKAGANILPYEENGPIKIPAGAIAVWTDGACTGNPGPAGLGVVVIDGRERKEISEYLGQGTNNIAELTAIERGLQAVPAEHRDRPIYVHSDSGYALGLLGKGWKAKANQELVARLRELVAQFSRIHLVKVPGHAGVSENERCDQLARMAIMTGR